MITYFNLSEQIIEGFELIDRLPSSIPTGFTAIFINDKQSPSELAENVLIISIGQQYQIEQSSHDSSWRMTLTTEMMPQITATVKVFYEHIYKQKLIADTKHIEAEQFKTFFDTIPANMYLMA